MKYKKGFFIPLVSFIFFGIISLLFFNLLLLQVKKETFVFYKESIADYYTAASLYKMIIKHFDIKQDFAYQGWVFFERKKTIYLWIEKKGISLKISFAFWCKMKKIFTHYYDMN